MPQGPLGLGSTPYPPVSGSQSPDAPLPLVRAVGVVTGALPLNRGYAEDAQGSVEATTDAAGGVTARYVLDAWGNVLSGAPIDNPFSFGGGYGYWQEAALGLYYVRARWLSPQTGSWLSVDPVLSEPRYAYVRNSPTMLVDPTGMQSRGNAAKRRRPPHPKAGQRQEDPWAHPEKSSQGRDPKEVIEVGELTHIVQGANDLRTFNPYVQMTSVERMSAADKIIEAINRSLPMFPAETQRQIQGLIGPTARKVFVGTLIAWALGHALGISEFVDWGLLVVGFGFVGMAVFDGIGALKDFATTAVNAKTDADLDRAGIYFAHAVETLGIATVSAVLLKGQAKTLAKRGLPKYQPRAPRAGTTASDANFSRSPSQMFREYLPKAKAALRIEPRNLARELRKSAIGRETLQIIEDKQPTIILDYAEPGPQIEGPGETVFGIYFEKFNEMWIFVTRTLSKRRTAQTVIHETTHVMGISGSQRAEVIAFMRAQKHVKVLSISDIREIIRVVRQSYPNYDWEIGQRGMGTKWQVRSHNHE